MGRAGAVLAADAMASHPGGRLAGAEPAVRPGLLRHRRLAAVGWRPRGAIRVGSGGVTHGRLYRYPQSHAHCDSLRRDDERAWELRRDHSSVGHRPRMPRFGVRPAARRSEEHTSELQSPCNLVCRLLLEKKKTKT